MRRGAAIVSRFSGIVRRMHSGCMEGGKGVRAGRRLGEMLWLIGPTVDHGPGESPVGDAKIP